MWQQWAPLETGPPVHARRVFQNERGRPTEATSGVKPTEISGAPISLSLRIDSDDYYAVYFDEKGHRGLFEWWR
jgi:hypothetical protein